MKSVAMEMAGKKVTVSRTMMMARERAMIEGDSIVCYVCLMSFQCWKCFRFIGIQEGKRVLQSYRCIGESDTDD